jgi:hypothetical protein
MPSDAGPTVWHGLGAFALLFLAFVLAIYRWERRRADEWNRRPTEPGSAARAMALVREHIATTLLLTPGQESAFSKLGGRPELPKDLSWPSAYEGVRTFVGQFDLAEIPLGTGPDWLTRQGRIYVFYDPDKNGLADLVSVLHSHATPGSPAPPPTTPWAEFRERRVDFAQRTSAPSLEWLGIDFMTLDREPEEFSEEREHAMTAPPPDSCQHRIGGYPNEIQFECLRRECERIARGLRSDAPVDEEFETASMQWRLLLQVDSDETLGMEWHDGGRLYVFIREPDARAADFSKTVTILQSY